MDSAKQEPIRIVDGQLSWDGGIDSGKPTTIQTQAQPYGVPRNMLAWLTNATVRGGGIRTRTGWLKLAELDVGLFQGGSMYEPDAGFPYQILSIAGRILLIHLDSDNSVVDLSAQFGLTNPATTAQSYFCQAEEFLIIQAGDLFTLPLFWDGTTLRRSKGVTNTGVAPGTPGVNELPSSGPMVYYQGRLWYAIGRFVNAGDIVGGNSGTAAFQFRDSVLNVTENPLVLGGDGFAVPSNSGNVRGLAYTANLDATLGQGPLYIFTAKQIYALTVPVTRTDWIAATGANAPSMTVAQIKWGCAAERSLVHLNGDLYYRTLEPAVRSLVLAIRFFTQFGNTPISRNMDRVMALEDRSLLHMSSGIEIENRLLMTILPIATDAGVAFQGISVLDFAIISGIQDKVSPTAQLTGGVVPSWEGMWEPGLTLQLFEDEFGGLQRGFAAMLSLDRTKIQIWEITNYAKSDQDDRRVTWLVETPAFNWNAPFDLKELDGAEFWIDKLYGTVDITLEYREDANECWHPWSVRRICTARNSGEVTQFAESGDYPSTIYCESGSIPVTFEKPAAFDCNDQNKRPVNVGCQFQLRLTVKGWCQIRGIRVFALPRYRRPFEGLSCP